MAKVPAPFAATFALDASDVWSTFTTAFDYGDRTGAPDLLAQEAVPVRLPDAEGAAR